MNVQRNLSPELATFVGVFVSPSIRLGTLGIPEEINRRCSPATHGYYEDIFVCFQFHPSYYLNLATPMRKTSLAKSWYQVSSIQRVAFSFFDIAFLTFGMCTL